MPQGLEEGGHRTSRTREDQAAEGHEQAGHADSASMYANSDDLPRFDLAASASASSCSYAPVNRSSASNRPRQWRMTSMVRARPTAREKFWKARSCFGVATF